MLNEAASVERAAPIREENQRHEEAIMRSLSLMEELEQRLQPILEQPRPSAEPPKKEAVGRNGDSPFVLMLRERNAALNLLNERLQGIVRRIEL